MTHWIFPFVTVILLLSPNNAKSQQIWNESIANKTNLHAVEHETLPTAYRLLEFDAQAWQNELTDQSKGEKCMDIPMPDGSEECFVLTESNWMPESLSGKYPNIKTYRGKSLHNPKARIYLVQTEADFHLIGDSDEGTFFIDQVSNGNQKLYMSFFAKDEVIPPHDCELHPNPESIKLQAPVKSNSVTAFSWGAELRKYRMAIVWTPGHVAGYGNDTTAIINRNMEIITDMNFVCERDLCVTFELAVNPENLIFPDENNNPYTGLGSATGIMNNAIGAENFEIGVVISGGGGGVSYLGVTCGGARGGSQSSNSHWVIVHELGHNMGAGHTFNHCPGWGGSGIEPGAGNSIMSYGGTGVCGAGHQVPGGRINYFHSISLEQMYNKLFVNSNCAENIATGNVPPEVTIPTGGFYIPKLTPFKLVGSATDANDASNLTYSWQQYKWGVGSNPATPTAEDPIFRMFPPLSSPERTIPRIEEIVGGYNFGEVLPDVSRTMDFRFYAFDNFAGGSGIAYDALQFHCDGNSGPFEVTFPNENTIIGAVNQTRTITWNVASTNVAPVNCSIVDILLSTDGGFTYPVTLASGVPNNGSYDIVIPDEVGTQNRIQIRAADNIFFDISDNDFEIVGAGTYDFSIETANKTHTVCNESSISYYVDLFALGAFNSNVDLSVNGLPAGATASFPNGSNISIISPVTVEITINNLSSISSGYYPFTLNVNGGGVNKDISFNFAKGGTSSTVPGNSMSFDGSGDYVRISDSEYFDFSRPHTIEMWIKPNNLGGYPCFISKDGVFHNHLNTDGSLRWRIFQNGSELGWNSINFGFEVNKWVHFAYVNRGDALIFYKNGVQTAFININANNTLDNSNHPLLFGIWRESQYPFNGEIEEVKIWKTARSVSQIRTDMHLNLSCQGDMVNYYQFNSGDASDIMGGQNGTLHGNTQAVVSSSPTGQGTSDTQTEANAVVTFQNVDFTANYSSSSGAEVTVSKIPLAPFGVNGIDGSDNIFNSQYWIANSYGGSGSLTFDATFTLSEDITISHQNNPIALKLYRRNSTAAGDWTFVSNATSANATSNTATFSGLNQYGQFLVTETTAPVAAVGNLNDSFCPTTVNDYSGNVLNYSVEALFLSAPLIINAPTGFEISLNENSGFSNSLTLNPSGGVINTTTIYVKFRPGSVGTISGNITHNTNGTSIFDLPIQGVSLPQASDLPGQSIQANSSGNYISIPSLVWQPTVFTVEFWLKPFSLSAWNQAIGPGWDAFLFHAGPDGSFYAGISAAAANSRILSPAGLLQLNKWSHIAISFDNGLLNVYHNGDLVGTQPSTVMPNLWNGNFDIGTGDGNNIHGELDEFRIWETARSQSEIRENMHHTMEVAQGCSDGLRVYYQFESFDGSTLNDAVGKHSGVVVGSPSLVTGAEPAGEGNANTQTETNGTVTFTGIGFTANYSSQVGASVTTSKIDNAPFGTSGIDVNDILLDDQYWVANRYGSTGNLNFNPTFTVNEGVSAIQAQNPIAFKLYGRGIQDDTDWTLLANGASANSSDNKVTFEGIQQYGQFFLTRSEQPTVGLSHNEFAFCTMTTSDLSTVYSYEVSGVFLNESILITAPSGFQVSTNSNSGWSSSLNIPPVGGVVASTTIYVRFQPFSTGDFSGQIAHSYGGSGNSSINVSGKSVADALDIADRAAYFDGSGDEVFVTNGENIDLINHTVELWFRPDWTANVGGFQTLFAKRSGAGTAVSLHVKSSQFAIWNGSASTLINYSFDASRWYHMACIMNEDENKTELYINGTLIHSSAVGYNQNLSSLPIVLGSNTTGGEYFHGYIDELKIWNSKRTTAQIREQMHLTANVLKGCSEGLIAYYQFDASGNSIPDKMGTYNASFSGDATALTSDAPVAEGISVSKTATSTGTYSFDNGGLETKLDINFPSIAPGGDIVVSYLTGEGFHGELPAYNTLNNPYWIVKNYGSTTTGLNATMTFTCPSGWMTFGTTTAYSAFKRRANAKSSNGWNAPNPVSSIDLGSNLLSVAGMDGFSQFAISKTEPATCFDGSQNGDETGIDCGGSCTPCTNCTYTQFDFNDFETDWGIWNDGGTDCRRNSNDGAYANSGTFCIRLVDDTETSVMTTNTLDLSTYNQMIVNFSYITNSMDDIYEDFWLQVSTDGGSSFTTIEAWNNTDEFENEHRKNESVFYDGTFTSTMQVRIRCDASGDQDYLYIDDVEIKVCNTQALPLELISFNGNRQGAKVALDWQSLNEIDIEGFEIQKRTGHGLFEPMGWVDANGWNENLNNYKWNDNTPDFSEIQYYRLKIMDWSGSYSYSRVVEIEAEDEAFNVTLFPNPSSEFIQLEISLEKESGIKLKLLDTTGRLVFEQQQYLKKGMQRLPIDLRDFPSGLYWVIVEDDRGLNYRLLSFVKEG